MEKEKAKMFIRELIPTLSADELARAIDNAYVLNIFDCDRYRYNKWLAEQLGKD